MVPPMVSTIFSCLPGPVGATGHMGPGPVRPVKTVKDFIQLVLGYALALIPKRKPHIARLSRFQPDFHPAILAPVFVLL